MLEPFTALGAASSIVQFIDFGSRLLVEGYGLYKSKEGVSKETVFIEQLVTETERIMGRLSATATSGSSSNPDEVGMQKLALRCRSLAEEILNLLQELKMDPNARFKTWESFWKAAKKTRKAKHIKRMRKELEKIHTEINTFLLSIIRASLANACSELQRQSNEYHMQNAQSLTAAKQDLMDAIRRQHQECKDFFEAKSRKEQEHLAAVKRLQASLGNLELRIDRMLLEGAKVTTTQSILRSLRFTTMEDRHLQIVDAHAETFTWIFEGGTTPFKDWLETHSGVFWVNGKAGSGKSTLMKYLNEHAETERSLRRWAAKQNKRLHSAYFYFWNSGTSEQSSQEGLLKTLLYQILRQCPELVPWASERRWYQDSDFHRLPDRWTRSELSEAIKNIIARGVDEFSCCFCFFVDGLDEYEGDQYSLIQDLDKLTASESVKMCVSSRPWTVFRERYGKSKDGQFVLQELTQPDMDKFVKDRLEEDPRFRTLQQSDPRADYFVSEISKRAEGVFLWVFLVVQSLLNGMSEKDNFDALQKRLDELPADLDDFFRHILNRIEPTYQEPMARLLLLSVKAFHLPLEAAYYLLEDTKNPDFALKEELGEMSEKGWEQMQYEATNLVHAWCKDLLEVKCNSNLHVFHHRIGFLHRTVRDFLVTQDMEANLASRTKAGFSPWLTLVRIHLRRAKLLGGMNHANLDWFVDVAQECLKSAKAYEQASGTTPTAHLLQLDRVGDAICKITGTEVKHWSDSGTASWNCPRYMNPNMLKRVCPSNDGFLSFTIAFDLDIFVKERLEHEFLAPTKEGSWPLLTFALHTFSVNGYDRSSTQRSPSHDIVKLLLDAGADPNEVNPISHTDRSHKLAKPFGYSVWSLFLTRCQNEPNADLWPTALLMLDHGADPSTELDVGGKVEEDTRSEAQGKINLGRYVPKFMSASQCLEASFVACGHERSELEYFMKRGCRRQNWHSRILSNFGSILGFAKGRS